MTVSTEYQKAYESAKQELADLLTKQQEVQKRIVLVRQSLQTLAGLCDSEGIQLDPSAEASYLLENTTLADEVRTVLKAAAPGFLRPREIKHALERLGHNLNEYQNPQATIHMVLKRMAESGEVQEEILRHDGKRTYRFIGPNPATSLPREGDRDEENIFAGSSSGLRGFGSRDARGRGRGGPRGRHGRRGQAGSRRDYQGDRG